MTREQIDAEVAKTVAEERVVREGGSKTNPLDHDKIFEIWAERRKLKKEYEALK